MSEFMLVSACEVVKLWEGTKCSLFQQIESPSDVSHVCCSPNGQFLAVSLPHGSKVPIYFCKKPLSQPIELLPEKPQSYVCFGNTSSRFVITCGDNPVVTIWDLKTRKATKTLHTGLSKGVTCAAYNSGDTHVASGGQDGSVVLTNAISSVSLAPMVPTFDEPQAISSMQFSPMQKNLLGTVADDGSCVLWDCNARLLLHSFTHIHAAPATGIAFSPTNEVLLATVGLDKRLLYYDLQLKKTVITVKLDFPSTCLDFSPDGTYVAIGGYKGSISIYDVRSVHTPINVISAHRKAVNSLTFNKLPGALMDWCIKPNDSVPDIALSQKSLVKEAATPERDNLRDSNSNSVTENQSPIRDCKLPQFLLLGQDSRPSYESPQQNFSAHFTSSPSCLQSETDPLTNATYKLAMHSISDTDDAVACTTKANGLPFEQWREEMKYEMYKISTSLHSDLLNLQMEMLRNFYKQKVEIEEMLGYRTLAANLMAEVNSLKKEISDLKKHF